MSNDTARITIEVAGMTCGHCVAAVTQELSALDGVSHVGVDLGTGRVELDVHSPVSDAEIAAAVDEAGYVVVGEVSR